MSNVVILHIHGVPIHLRPLPSGDMAVWHPCNDPIRAIVEPICRNRGRWEGQYQNWIVFHQFRAIVSDELRAEADHG
ncbi:hypothetical protein CEW87_05570 [Parazoarcus communis]|uniref:Uncharacterized protein n=1 Tax=Parazoarcus communis TaxID=41977 RepID=A0A2U8GYV4_9RHOO|nr:hypothetical protein [Parazoarcus communis]AWI78872.1 hypothetical protein CEW87_05570 [Parazoarcus communis]